MTLTEKELTVMGARAYTPADVAPLLPSRPAYGHKGTFGHVLLAAGSYGMAGAAVLSARAALAGGAGKVTVHTPSCNLPVLQIAFPEAIVRPDCDDEKITRIPDAGDYDAVGIGPGIGRHARTAEALESLLDNIGKPVVVDADAINILSLHPERMRLLPKESILTPHAGELGRLLPEAKDGVALLEGARRLAARYGVHVIVKGHRTALCMPGGDLYFNTTGNSGMATAGSGDVLTGILCALLAQGCRPADACRLGVCLHGLAGDRAAALLGEYSMMASDIIGGLPSAFQQLIKLQRI